MPKAEARKHPLESLIESIDPDKLKFTTADGATVVPGDSVYNQFGDAFHVTGFGRIHRGEAFDILGNPDGQPISLKIREMYSSTAAAKRGRIGWLKRAREGCEAEIAHHQTSIVGIDAEIAMIEATLATES